MRQWSSVVLLSLLLQVLFVVPLLSQVAWVPRLDEALRLASAESKLIVVDVAASWCPPCQKMAREVYPSREFAEFSRTQVFMLVDAEKDSEGVLISSRYNVRSYPTILVLDTAGKEIDRLTGRRGTETLIRDLQAIFDNPVPYSTLLKQARAKDADFRLLHQAGKRAVDRDDYASARQLLGRAVELSSAQSREDRVSVLVLLSLAAFKQGKYRESLDAMDELSQLEPELTERSHELQLQRARVLTLLKRNEE
ncbi:MAG: thioredoxin family protein, partial [Acidobacteriota bacterium]